MHGYWEALQRLVAEGVGFVSVTLVDVEASAPADVGAKMLVTEEGLYHGSVGGGKIEAKAIGEAVAWLKERGQGSGVRGQRGGGTKFVEWNLQRDVGMTCGGVARLFFEAYNVGLWRVVIFGAGHCSQALVRLMMTMRCDLTVIDPREDWIAKLPPPQEGGASGARLRIIKAEGEMKGYVKDLPGGAAGAFVVLMTMGHSSDQPILIELLKTRGGIGVAGGIPYLGVIGSAAKAGALKRGLMAAGISEEDATPGNRYLCPVGLPIGTNDPAEIAVSVAGQLLEWRDKARE